MNLFPGVSAITAIACLVACSGRPTSTAAPDLPAECSAFIAKYEACLTLDVPSAPGIAKARAAQTRAALEEQAHSSSSNLAALTTKCRDNLQRLATSCSHAN